MVIDGVSDGVIAAVPSYMIAVGICYNLIEGKVYCAGENYYPRSGCGVAIIDSRTNQIVTTISLPDAPPSLLYNSINNKVYCAGNDADTVHVIDGTSDSLVSSIGVGRSPVSFGWNERQNRIYVANWGGSSISVLRDSGGGIEQSFRPQATSSKPAPTIIRGAIWLAPTSSPKPQASSLLDATGRHVMYLRPGANDVRALAPGVYFLRGEGRGTWDVGGIRKVVVTR